MKKILILTHGYWGKYLIESAKMIVGDTSNLESIALLPQDTLEEYENKVKKKVEENRNNVIFLTDIAGGTTTNVAIKLAYPLNLKVLSGLSAPLLFEVINANSELEKDETIQEIIYEARENCKDVLKSLLK
ncbi:PTS sugar transporter subunit IIA [uncultured Fusobacterium sp.]|uniref:PTS sugar transporter subunit IIA n=1 Tax=uncultured Fusobacterium sp. TaxID=159267 RepID=UPI002604A50C|nr:PTS sugar transporter subunit IIA [uncultured Fusobacterium sp.]